jgi:vitamin B12 transporter
MVSYPYDEFELKSYASYLAAQINDTWNSRLELGHSESRRFFRADDSTAKNSLSTYRDTVNWLNDLRLNAEHSLTLGAEWYEDSLNSNTAYAGTRPLTCSTASAASTSPPNWACGMTTTSSSATKTAGAAR